MAARLKQVAVETQGEATQGARRATGGASPCVGAPPAVLPDPEVVEQAGRRRFTAKYKLGVL